MVKRITERRLFGKSVLRKEKKRGVNEVMVTGYIHKHLDQTPIYL